MIDSGIGAQQENRFLTAINVPGVSHQLLKSYERKVGPAMEEVAKNMFGNVISGKGDDAYNTSCNLIHFSSACDI